MAGGVPLRIITPNDVRASISRAKRNLEKAAEEIVWQIEMEGWRTLGYRSWSAMREAEYGGAAFMVPARQRPELVARMAAKDLTQREIAATAGVAVGTVNNDLRAFRNEQEQDDDVIDAEIVEDDTPTTADPVAAESAPTEVTCPTCGGTGRVPTQ